jgi:hypothetical protein
MKRCVTWSAAAAVAICCGCSSFGPREPLPVTPPGTVANAPVTRVPLPAPSSPPAPAGPSGAAVLPPIVVPANTLYVCAVEANGTRTQTAIEFEPKVGELCRRHPEMGPCQFERNACRRKGGRVFAADGNEITLLTETEYDKKVMRVRFRAN